MKKRVISTLLMICMLLSAFVGCEKDEEIEKDPGKIENDGKFNGVTYRDYFYMIDRIVEKDAEFISLVAMSGMSGVAMWSPFSPKQ